MKFANGKWNKTLVIGVVLYCIMLLDIVINTAIAHISNNGQSRITNAVMVGPIVLNPISVLLAFVLGTLFVLIGVILKHKSNN